MNVKGHNDHKPSDDIRSKPDYSKKNRQEGKPSREKKNNESAGPKRPTRKNRSSTAKGTRKKPERRKPSQKERKRREKRREPKRRETEEEIKALLNSANPEVRSAGLCLVDQHFRHPVMGYIRYIYGSAIPPYMLPEIFQETLIKLCRNVMRRTFSPKGTLESYLRCIARRSAIDWLRKKGRRREVSLDAHGDIMAVSPEDHPAKPFDVNDPHTQAMLEGIRIAISELSPALREAMLVDLDYLKKHGKFCTQRELARRINERHPKRKPMPPKTAASRRRRALEKLGLIL